MSPCSIGEYNIYVCIKILGHKMFFSQTLPKHYPTKNSVLNNAKKLQVLNVESQK